MSFLVPRKRNKQMDLAAVATEIAGVKADILEVGGLIIGLAVTAMGIRWVRATFFESK